MVSWFFNKVEKVGIFGKWGKSFRKRTLLLDDI